MPQEDIWRPLREIVSEFLRASDSHFVLAEDFVESVTPDFIPKPVYYFTCAGSGWQNDDREIVSVFSFLPSGPVTREAVEEFIGSAFPFHEVYILVSLPEGAGLTSGARVTRSDLRELAEHSRYVGIGAYDGSGVIIWERAK